MPRPVPVNVGPFRQLSWLLQLPWSVEVLARRRFWRDGSLDVLAGEDEPRSVPLALATTVTGVPEGSDLVAALESLQEEREQAAAKKKLEAEDKTAAESKPLYKRPLILLSLLSILIVILSGGYYVMKGGKKKKTRSKKY